MTFPSSTSSGGTKCADKPRLHRAAQTIHFQSHQTGVPQGPHCRTVKWESLYCWQIQIFFLNNGIAQVLIPCVRRRRGKRQISPMNAKRSYLVAALATSLCTSEVKTGALDKFKRFTGREVIVQTVPLQESNSPSQHTTVQISGASSFNASVHCKLQLGLCPDTHYQK